MQSIGMQPPRRVSLCQRVQQHLCRHVATFALRRVAEQLFQRRHLALRNTQTILTIHLPHIFKNIHIIFTAL